MRNVTDHKPFLFWTKEGIQKSRELVVGNGQPIDKICQTLAMSINKTRV